MVFRAIRGLCNHHHNQFENIFITPKRDLIPFNYHHLPQNFPIPQP